MASLINYPAPPKGEGYGSGPNGFLLWLRDQYPGAYNLAKDRSPDLFLQEQAGDQFLTGDFEYGPGVDLGGGFAGGLAGLGDDAVTAPDTPPATDWGQRLMALVAPVLQTYQEKQLVDVNVKRAEKGLPPVDAAGLAPQVNVGVSKNVERLGWAALAGLAVLGGLALMKKGRRA